MNFLCCWPGCGQTTEKCTKTLTENAGKPGRRPQHAKRAAATAQIRSVQDNVITLAAIGPNVFTQVLMLNAAPRCRNWGKMACTVESVTILQWPRLAQRTAMGAHNGQQRPNTCFPGSLAHTAYNLNHWDCTGKDPYHLWGPRAEPLKFRPYSKNSSKVRPGMVLKPSQCTFAL